MNFLKKSVFIIGRLLMYGLLDSVPEVVLKRIILLVVSVTVVKG